MQVRFRRPLRHRSLQRDVPGHRDGHEPHRLRGFRESRDASGTVRRAESGGTQGWMSLNARHGPLPRCVGGTGSCRPTG